MRKYAYQWSLLYIVVLMSVGAIGGVARLAGIPVFFFWLLGFIRNPKLRRFHLFHILLTLFVVWNTASYFWSVSPDETTYLVNRYLPMLATAVILWDLYRTREEVEGGLQAFLVGCYILIFWTLFNAAIHNSYYNGRFTGGGLHPNTVGFLIAVGNPLAWYFAWSRRSANKLLGMAFFLFPVIGTLAIILTGSRGGVVASLPGYIYIFSTMRNLSSPAKLTLLGLGVALMVAITQINLSYQIGRIAQSASSGSTDKFSGRTQLWQAAEDIFSKNPLLGVGGGGYRRATIGYDVPDPDSGKAAGNSADTKRLGAHNTYLEVLSELGIVGFGIIVLILFATFRAVTSVPKPAMYALLVSFLAFPIDMFYEMIEWRPFTWLILGLLVAAGSAADKLMTRNVAAQNEAPVSSVALFGMICALK